MANSSEINPMDLPPLLYRLCSRELDGLPADKISVMYQAATVLLSGSRVSQFDGTDEFYVMEKIKNKLSTNMKDSDALRFEELYHKLNRSDAVKKPISFLMFFYYMSQLNSDAKYERLNLLHNTFTSNKLDSAGLAGHSKVSVPNQSHRPLFIPKIAGLDILKLSTDSRIPANASINLTSTISPTKTQFRKNLARQQRPHTIHCDDLNSINQCSEIDLLREVLFAFQGLSGKILTIDDEGKFKTNPTFYIQESQKRLLLRLSNMGWLFNRVNKFTQNMSKEPTNGHVCQSFASALNDEILEYYRLITVIEEQLHASVLNENTDLSESSNVTLHRLQVWAFDSFYRLKKLAQLVNDCQGKRGGVLAFTVHNFMQNGDPQTRKCITRILGKVSLPIRRMISEWIFHGELEDTYKEFFITTSKSGLVSPGDTLWHEKYSLNTLMLPGFITIEQANKILATGKAVNLLRQVCRNNNDTESIPGYEDLKATFEATNINALFVQQPCSKEDEFQRLLETAYKETSQKALKILFDDYHFMSHLEGLKLFLLVGQGDFISHLMDIMEPVLCKPSSQLVVYNIQSLLNSAIRATNAQFLKEDVLDRVDCRFLDRSLEDLGWDVFVLTYQTNGPISTVITSQCMLVYSSLFKYLWRSKRMYFVVTNLWQNQTSSSNLVKLIPQLKPVFHMSHILLAEMRHFIQQMQYYIAFEVMECSWAELLRFIVTAEDIDQLAVAHQKFLQKVQRRLMLDSDSQNLADQLRAIYDVIIEFQKIENKWLDDSSCEYEMRLKSNSEDRNTEKTENERRKKFEVDVIPKMKIKVQMLSSTYQDMVQQFLLLLADHSDADLRFLSFRLDFNEHYKKRDKRLETSFTWSRHRLSLDISK